MTEIRPGGAGSSGTPRDLLVGLLLAALVTLLESLLDGRSQLLTATAWLLWSALLLMAAVAFMVSGLRRGADRLQLWLVVALVVLLVLPGLVIAALFVQLAWQLVHTVYLSEVVHLPLPVLCLQVLALLGLCLLICLRCRVAWPRLARGLERLLLAVTSATLLLLAGEALFRLTGSLGMNSWEVSDSKSSLQPYAEFLWRGRFGGANEFAVTIRNNRFGFNDLDRSREKPPGVKRVVVLGDSYVEAYQVPLQQTFHKQLETLLRQQQPAVEVHAFGRSGSGPIEEARLLASVAIGFAPDLVLLAFLPANDIRNSEPALEQQAREESGFSLNRSSLYVLARYYRLDLVGQLLWRADTAIKARHQPPLDSLVYLDEPADDRWAAAWNNAEAAILEMRDLATAHDARFAVVSLTSPGAITWYAQEHSEQARQQMARTLSRLGPPPRGTWDFAAPDRHLQQLCHDNQIPLLLLAPIFAQLPPQERRHLHFRFDGHWTAPAHHHAAIHLAQLITKHHLLDG